MSIFSPLARLFRRRERGPADDLAQLLRAAQEDEAFRRQLLYLLRAPAMQRESLVNSALHEMELRGEAKSTRAAFAVLATDAGAKTALEVLANR